MGDGRPKYVLEKIDSLMEFVDRTIDELNRSGNQREARRYAVVRNILSNARDNLSSGNSLNPSTTYMVPGALWLVDQLVNREMPLSEAVKRVGAVEALASAMLRELVYVKNLTLQIPSNLSDRDIRIYVWTNKIADNMYELNMFFFFPFDIAEIDRRTEYEPVTFVFEKRDGKLVPVKVYTRVHYNLYEFDVSNLDRIAIRFARMGHTPIVLNAEAVPDSDNRGGKLREILDKTWLYIGSLATEITGYREVKMADILNKVRLSPILPRTANNVFKAKISRHQREIELNFN